MSSLNASAFSEEEKAKQAAARARLKERAARYRSEGGVQPAPFPSRPTTKDLVDMGEGLSPDAPQLVRDPAQAPEGPPWHYDITPDERAEKDEKRERRAEKKQRVKQNATKFAPEKLKNPSGFQVRFRTGAVYTALTIICVLAGSWPMVIMLMLVAGISAGEFYYMLRSDAKLPNERVSLRTRRSVDGFFGAAACAARVVCVLAAGAHSRCRRKLFRGGLYRLAALRVRRDPRIFARAVGWRRGVARVRERLGQRFLRLSGGEQVRQAQARASHESEEELGGLHRGSCRLSCLLVRHLVRAGCDHEHSCGHRVRHRVRSDGSAWRFGGKPRQA